MKDLKSWNVDSSFILQQKLIPPKKFEKIRKNNRNAWLGHNIIVSCLVFLEIIVLTLDLFSESQLYPRSEQNNKRKTPREQEGPICAGHQTSEIFVLNIEIVFI